MPGLFRAQGAIAILWEWPSTNGVWHSLQAAKVAEWIANIEEKCSGGLGFIPEHCRVVMQSLKVSLQQGVITLECVQSSLNGALEPRKANLYWP